MKRIIVLRQWTENRDTVIYASIAFAQELARRIGSHFDYLYATDEKTAKLAGLERFIEQPEFNEFGAERAFLALDSDLSFRYPQAIGEICARLLSAEQDMSIAAPATRLSTEVLSFVAERLDLPLVTSVCGIDEREDQLVFRTRLGRDTIQTARIDGERAAFTIDITSFGAPERPSEPKPLKSTRVDVSELPSGTVWKRFVKPQTARGNLQTARVVVAGGRALGDAKMFDRLIGGLAEKLGGAKAATGAAVQAGIAPSEILIGQTGQYVAPDLYIAAGISGSDQHTAGFRDARVIVAINSNPNATIFRMADYGLVADVHQALPELIEKL